MLLSASTLTVAANATSQRGEATRQTPNWAGYVVTAQATTYTSVTATWKQPPVSCTAGDRGAAVSFWVGLGGSSPTAQALEQAGTASDCSASGATTYHAWYEIVPGSAVTTGLAVAPGDTITVSVNIAPDRLSALFQIKNRTTRTASTNRVALTSPPDLSSADWIVEAPSRCQEYICLPVPLERFGPIAFSRIAALGNGIGGTLGHPAWLPERLELVPSTVLVTTPGSSDAPAGASARVLSADGSSFQVLWNTDESASGL